MHSRSTVDCRQEGFRGRAGIARWPLAAYRTAVEPSDCTIFGASAHTVRYLRAVLCPDILQSHRLVCYPRVHLAVHEAPFQQPYWGPSPDLCPGTLLQGTWHGGCLLCMGAPPSSPPLRAQPSNLQSPPAWMKPSSARQRLLGCPCPCSWIRVSAQSLAASRLPRSVA